LERCAREALAALLLLGGCAGGGDAARRDIEALRGEVRELRQENANLAHRVELLTAEVDAASARLAHGSSPPAAKDDAEKQPVIPPDLAVVRVAPPSSGARAARTPPPVPTAVAIGEPDSAQVAALSRRGGRDLATEAEAELRRARAATGNARARALVEFVARYPRHPEADNALVEASAAYADSGIETESCGLAQRAAADYPAGDALPEALERLAWCEGRHGAHDAERKLLERLVQEFPKTPAAQRAGTRLATISGRAGSTPDGPARSGP
jgi:TolA-binding protein